MKKEKLQAMHESSGDLRPESWLEVIDGRARDHKLWDVHFDLRRQDEFGSCEIASGAELFRDRFSVGGTSRRCVPEVACRKLLGDHFQSGKPWCLRRMAVAFARAVAGTGEIDDLSATIG